MNTKDILYQTTCIRITIQKHSDLRFSLICTMLHSVGKQLFYATNKIIFCKTPDK